MAFNPIQFYEYGKSRKGTLAYTGQIGLTGASVNVNNPLLYPISNGLTMSPDGTKVFAVLHNGNNEGFTRDCVMQFDLLTPWDLTTMTTLIGNTPSLNSFPGFSEQSPVGAFFSPDGFNLYVAGGGLNRVYRYTLTSAYTPSTATAHSSVATGLILSHSLAFSQDGAFMFVGSIVSSTIPRISRYLLSSPWDITTAVLNGSTIDVTDNSSLFFTTDGMNFFTFNANIIRKYILSVAWDLGSIVTTQVSPDVSSIGATGQLNALYFSSNGKRLIFNNYLGRVKAIDLSVPFKIDGDII